jgi:hypothetical protein
MITRAGEKIILWRARCPARQCAARLPVAEALLVCLTFRDLYMDEPYRCVHQQRRVTVGGLHWHHRVT